MGAAYTTPVDALDERPILRQGSDLPLLRGGSAGGIDLVCGNCRAQVLAVDIARGQIWDIIFHCRCGALSASDRLPPGEALPTVVLLRSKGVFRLDSTVDLRSGAIVGEPAVVQRRRETGADFAPDFGGQATPARLRDLCSMATALLGDSFTRLRSQYERGKRHATPPKNPHRLVEIIEATEAAADSLHGTQPQIDASAVGELLGLVTIFERWKRHPAWPQLVKELCDPDNYYHSLTLLCTASFLVDVGNDVEILAAGGSRTADLRLRTTPFHYARVEVKTPRLLRANLRVLELENARRTILSALTSAGVGSRGQLPRDMPGILAIGGFGRRNDETIVLEQAASALVRESGSRFEHIAGIALLTFGTRIAVSEADNRISAAMNVRFAPNPHYRGAIRVNSAPADSKILDAASVNISFDGANASWEFGIADGRGE